MAGFIVFAIFAGFGLVMLGVGLKQNAQQKRLLALARPVDVEITRSEVHTSTSRAAGESRSTTTHRPDVEFRYQVGGVTHTSDLLYPSEIVTTFASQDSAAEVLRPYPVGATVKAFVDDTRPDKAFLIREAGNGPTVFIIIGILLPPVAWFAGRLV